MSPRPVPPGALSPEDAAAWARVRRYAVPRWMIERATEARVAGDWKAACAAAAFDVPDALDPERIADRYGPDVAARVADDLRHLVPDLLRWHLPRNLGGHTTLTPCRRIVLASYGRSGPVLSVTTSPMLAGPQRLPLHFGPVPAPDLLHGLTYATEDWTAARRFWDDRHTGELRYSAGSAGSGRLPFLRPDGTPLSAEELPAEDPGTADPAARAEWVAVLQARGHHAGAYAAAGLDLDLTPPPRGPRSYRELDVTQLIGSSTPDLTRVAPEIRLLERAGRGTRFRVPVEWRGHLRIELDAADAEGAPARVVGRERDQEDGVPLLPGYAWQRLPDIGLLRAGRIRPEDLHPLVTAALFPWAGTTVGPPGPRTPAPVRVRCGGAWHQVESRGGVLDIPHTEQERQRELALRAFGGTVTGCFAAQHAWTSGEGRLPRALREQRRELFQHVQHGDTPAVLALLDAGTDPRVRDRMGRGLLHVLHLLDHRKLLPRLLAAGLDLEAKDGTGRTPLQNAVHNGGSAVLVRDFLGAGARIDVIDEMELSLAQVIRRYERNDLMFLRRRVLSEHPGIGSEWFDEYMSERDSEPDWDEDEAPSEEPDPLQDRDSSGETDPFGEPDPFGDRDSSGEADLSVEPDPFEEPDPFAEPQGSGRPGQGSSAAEDEDVHA
ncbi:ankyrin repeat domain-containing protein [Streptomyces sp. NPDC059567]|uniref:ankyrin repeat domain-containing protein n=1 Tax=Streptomyces sp. NPDC059567 TaxID=3346867 RepID=UPI0036B894BC